jgi:bifunctional UDP-N-acetylglucosamine pyrophosphorylase/glucosamine-1-phosphate N-acetyltransferase
MPQGSRPLAAIILAAGRGTRMKSPIAKVLHLLAGDPLIKHVVTLARSAGARPISLVVGHQADAVREMFAGDDSDLLFAHQAEQLGTGHAASIGLSALESRSGDVLLLCGDVPLLRPETLGDLICRHREAGATVTILSALLDDPSGYGRIVRQGSGGSDGGGRVLEIVEDADAAEGQRAIREINSGTYIFDLEFLSLAIPRIQAKNNQGEYYLTDVTAMAVGEGRLVEAFPAPEPEEASGVNDTADLARAKAYFTARRDKGR